MVCNNIYEIGIRMSSFHPVAVLADDDGQRLDRWLKKYYAHVTYGDTQKAIRKGEIRINGKRAKADSRLETKDEVRLPPYFQKIGDSPKRIAKAENKILSQKDRDFIRSLVIYEDRDIIAINKPAGLASQGGSGIKDHVDRLLDGLKRNPDDARPKLVHRLDKDTSGIMVFGRTAESTRHLMQAFKGRDVKKVYMAVTLPAPKRDSGEIRAALSKSEGKYESIQVNDEDGKSARTLFHTLDKAGKAAALMAFCPLTGRTHQIRVHAAEVLETPILGDFKYGFNKEVIAEMPIASQLHLHAAYLSIPRPQKGKWELKAKPAAHIQKTIDYFNFSYDLETLEALF